MTEENGYLRDELLTEKEQEGALWGLWNVLNRPLLFITNSIDMYICTELYTLVHC